MPDIEIEIYNAGAVGEDEAERDFSDPFAVDSSDAEPSRRKLLRALRQHALGNTRKLTIGDQEIVDRLAKLEAAAPHFGEALGLIRRAVVLSMRTEVGLAIPPLLWVSEPGLGKTWLARRLAETLGVPMGEFSFASGDDPGVLTGHSLSRRGARAGLVAKTLLFGDSANPVVFIDEVDKSLRGDQDTDCLHALLEPENARRYVDQFLDFPIRADRVIWILTANTIENLKPSLIDRTLVMRIERPSAEEQRRVLRSIVEEALAPYVEAFPAVTHEALLRLSECSPRLAKKIVVLALAYAVADGRLDVGAAEVEAARRVVEGKPGRRPIGFHVF